MSVETDSQNVKGREANETEMYPTGVAVSVSPETDAAQVAKAVDRRPPTRRRNVLFAVLGIGGLVVICVLSVPWVRLALTTVSTDDAYVNGHVTFVAPRIAGPDFPSASR